ncbi:MAG: sugar phosphate nucleotidyltransferase, partial [Candidatus Gracilibacteria bacterium]|nr:sugar phosphate nucleotidyltransferase [Candidatus Gracilibacteria bacterium]
FGLGVLTVFAFINETTFSTVAANPSTHCGRGCSSWLGRYYNCDLKNKRAIEDHFDSNFELEKKLEESNKFEMLEQVKMLNNMANITYLRQPYPRGDGDAILRAKPFLGDEPFLVLFGDDLIDGEKSAAEQLIEVYERKNAPVIATIPVSDTKKFQNIE